MKGISSSVTDALPTQARMDCADNTGAKIVQLMNVLRKGGVARRYPAAGVGDLIRVTVRRGTPETRRQIFTAVIIRQKRPFRRVDGTWVSFEDKVPDTECRITKMVVINLIDNSFIYFKSFLELFYVYFLLVSSEHCFSPVCSKFCGFCLIS